MTGGQIEKSKNPFQDIRKLSIRDIVKKTGLKSPNGYAQYERGHVNITVNKFEQLLEAVNPCNPPRLKCG